MLKITNFYTKTKKISKISHFRVYRLSSVASILLRMEQES